MNSNEQRFCLKVLRVHKLALQNLARLEGEPMSVVLRGLIREEAYRRGVWPADFLDNPRQSHYDMQEGLDVEP